MKPETKKELIEWIKDLLIAIVVAVLILQVIQPTIVCEHSMENTFHESDYLFVYKLAYKGKNEPQYGDVVIFKSDLELANGAKKNLIKRVIGTPGDTLAIKDGMVYLNGEALDEPYTKDGFTNGDIDEFTIPEGKLFCMGDNRLGSSDSRDSRIGLVDEKSLMGKAVFRLLPLKQIGAIRNEYKK